MARCAGQLRDETGQLTGSVWQRCADQDRLFTYSLIQYEDRWRSWGNVVSTNLNKSAATYL
jgi:hypothetical protein